MKDDQRTKRSQRQRAPRRPTEVDPLAAYMREVAHYPLLSRADEQEIGQELSELRAQLARLESPAGRSPRAELLLRKSELIDRMQKVRDRLVIGNLRLVVSIAKRFRYKGLTLLDLIDEGNLGLIHAAQRYDHTKGCKFSTYATWWVRQAVEKAIAESGRAIRIPGHVVMDLRQIERESVRYFTEHGASPSTKALSAAVRVPEAKVRSYLRFLTDVGSLDMPLDDEQGSTVLELQTGTGYLEPFESAYQSQVKRTFENAFCSLDEREREIIVLRFGLGGKGPLTLEEIGRVAGITRERVRQVLNGAIGKLRLDPAVRHLQVIA